MGKPSKGTPADKRLGANQPKKVTPPKSSSASQKKMPPKNNMKGMKGM
jgi:hypothetical protein